LNTVPLIVTDSITSDTAYWK